MFEPIRELTSKTVVLSEENIDTDQIIPARFLTTTSREGLGKAAFYDWRYDDGGRPLNSSKLHVVDDGNHAILVAGSNFGCGSSREHAPWALLDLGIKAVISSDIADIFKSNSLKNGLLPIEVDAQTHKALLEAEGASVTIDLETQEVTFAVGDQKSAASFEVEAFARKCLLNGVDPLGHIMNNFDKIEKFEAQRA